MLFATLLCCFAMSAQRNVYSFTVEDLEGQPQSLRAYKGMVLLVVNTATRCGFTPQYEELQALYEKFAALGFEILDFPCNQLGEQAPGSNEDIHSFCAATFNITFPQFGKIDVNGPSASPLFTYLKAKQGFGGFDLSDKMGALLDGMLRKADPAYDKKPDVKWNFTKFLVNKKGKVVRRFEPSAPMAEVEAAVSALLK